MGAMALLLGGGAAITWGIATAPATHILAGTILDGRGDPLSGVIVRVTDREGVIPDTTDSDGSFRLEVRGESAVQVSFLATKDGYIAHRSDPRLPNARLQFTMRRSP